MKEVMKIMKEQKTMTIFDFKIKDEDFTGNHLKKLGKLLVKRASIEEVHLDIKDCPKVGNSGLK